MLRKDDCVKVVRAFRAKHAIDAPDENVIATIHLMNAHGIDQNAAMDQSSRSANDNGIDAWYYNLEKKELFVYQSKLSDSKSSAAHGFGDLDRAREWLESVIVTGQLEQAPSSNQCLYNLYTRVSAVRHELKRIHFALLSPFDSNEIEDHEDFQTCETALGRSKLNAHIRDRQGGRLERGDRVRQTP